MAQRDAAEIADLLEEIGRRAALAILTRPKPMCARLPTCDGSCARSTTQSAHYAGGLTLDQIETQHAMVDALNRRYRGRFRILKGIESDILADGALDYPPQVLQRFDSVVASVHSRFRLGRDEKTKRIIAAVSNPYTTILGHLTGRQLLRRPGYDVDVEAVLKACAEHGVAVEINGNPWRLELDWRWHRKALAFGCRLSINPDAHSIAELDLVKWGVAVARKGVSHKKTC